MCYLKANQLLLKTETRDLRRSW